MNDVTNLVIPSSELAFDRAITVLFNQDINGSIATFFTNVFGRKDISDMVNPELFEPSSDLYSQMNSNYLNQSEKDLLSILHICNRCFVKFYGSPINEDWSNVTIEHFDNIGEEYGYLPIDRNVVQNSSRDVSQHMITKSSNNMTSSNKLMITQYEQNTNNDESKIKEMNGRKSNTDTRFGKACHGEVPINTCCSYSPISSSSTDKENGEILDPRSHYKLNNLL
mgnify:FL=1